jgi:hypothetical protein
VYHSDTEILFPMRVAPGLRELRGRKWQRLVERALEAPDGDEPQLAFGLLLIRLAGCLTCHPDSYRALRGCTTCATHVVRRHRGDDDDLTVLYQRALLDIELYLADLDRGNSAVPQTVLGEVTEA